MRLHDFSAFVISETARGFERLGQALEVLPPRQAEIISSLYFEGKSVKQTAEALSIESQTVRNHVHKAMKTLREYLTRKGWSDLIEVWDDPGFRDMPE